MVGLTVLDRIDAIIRLRITLASRGLGTDISNLMSTAIILFVGSIISLVMAVLFGKLVHASVDSGDLQTLHFNLKVAFSVFFMVGVIIPIAFHHLQLGIDTTRFRIYPIGRTWLYVITVCSGFGSPEHILYYPALAAIYITGVLPAGGGAAIGTAVILLLLFFYVVLGGAIALVLQGIMRKRKTRELLYVLFFLVLAVVWFVRFMFAHGWIRTGGPVDRAIEYLRAVPVVYKYLPPAIAADTITSLHRGAISSALHGILLLCLWITAVAAVGYLVFSKLQFGERGGKQKGVNAARPRHAAARMDRAAVFDLSGLLPLPVATYAVMTKELRYIVRSAVGRSTMFIVPCFTVIYALMIREAVRSTVLGIRPGEFACIVVSIYIVTTMGSYICNSFQWDGGGIQIYFFSPVSLSSIIAGKNLAIAVYSTLLFCVSTVAWWIMTHELPPLTFATGFLIFANSILTAFIAGNGTAIKHPVPCDVSRMRWSLSQTAHLIVLFMIIVIIVYLAAVLILPYMLSVSALRLPFLLILLVLQVTMYRIVLRSAAGLMSNGREILLNRLLTASSEIR